MNQRVTRTDLEGLRAAFDHDLKTPLAVIIGYAELLRLRPDDEQTCEEAPRRILEAAERLSLELDAVAVRLARIAP